MSYDAQVLAQGFLPSAEATLYTCPSGKNTIIRTIKLVNTQAADEDFQEINMWIRTSGGTNRHITPQDFTLYGREMAEDTDLALSEGDVVRAQTTDANTVEYLIMGVERTP